MTYLAAAGVMAAFVAAAILVRHAVDRTGLGVWHPATAWLGLEAVFFGAGSAILAITEERVGPALDVAGAIVMFGVGVALSDRFARRPRVVVEPGVHDAQPGQKPTADVRWPVVFVMVAVAVAVLVPTLLAVGIPALTGDVTGARAAIGGVDVQLLRVAIPGAIVLLVVAALDGSRAWRVFAAVAVAVAVAGELALASRYLAAELAAAIVIALGLIRRPGLARVIAAVAVTGAALFVVAGVLRTYGEAGDDPVGFAVDRSINRILLVEPRTLDAIQTAFPGEVPYYGGLTWVRRLAPFVGVRDVPNLGYWIYPRVFPDQQAVAGYAAPGLLGEAWANFGPFGVLVPGVLGVLAERLGATIAVRRRSAADLAAGSLGILFLARTHAIGLDGLAVLAVVVILWRLLAAPVSDLTTDLSRTLRWET